MAGKVCSAGWTNGRSGTSGSSEGMMSMNGRWMQNRYGYKEDDRARRRVEREVDRRPREELTSLSIQDRASDDPAGSEARYGKRTAVNRSMEARVCG